MAEPNITVRSDVVNTVQVQAKRNHSDEVTLVVGDLEWRGWTSVRVTRGIERCPSDFQLEVTENYADAAQIAIKPGDPCELYLGDDRVVTGYVNRYMATIGDRAHTITIVGRGRCQDLVDCAAKWPGQQIMASSVLEVAQKLAAPYGIEVKGEPGPPVGQGGSTLIPQLMLMLGETCWEIIEKLCRIAGLLAFEQADGSLLLTVNPGDVNERIVQSIATNTDPATASGFAEGVNVERATVVFSDDQRFGRYEAYMQAFWQWSDVNKEGNLIATAIDAGAPRPARERVVVAEMSHNLGIDNAKARAVWEANRRWGRSHVLTLTTDSWRDSSGKLYEPNVLAALDLPTLKVEGVSWLISEVTYRKGHDGTHADLLLMPAQAFSVQPTLPPYVVPGDVARLKF